MRSGVFVSVADPPLRLRPDAAWQYLGTSRFDLKGIAHVERHHFVAIDGVRVTRMLVLQFENILPGVDEQYHWSVRTPRKLGGIPYQYNVFAFAAEEAVRNEPHAEMAHTMRFLEQHGLRLDSEQIVARFARVVGEQRLHELIIFYHEPLAGSGYRLAQILDDGENLKAEFRGSADALTRRAVSSFVVLPP